MTHLRLVPVFWLSLAHLALVIVHVRLAQAAQHRNWIRGEARNALNVFYCLFLET